MTQRFGKRFFAGVMLVSMAAVAAAPLPAHSWIADADCHHTASAGIALSEPAAPSGCDHSAGTACAAMVGCVLLPSALAVAAPRFRARAVVAGEVPIVNRVLHGRLGFGPPTPPPNS